MKIKEDLMLRNIQGDWVVVPMGERLLEFNGIMRVNESGAFLWKKIEEGLPQEDIVSALFDEYDIDLEISQKEVETFINLLLESNILEA